MISLPFSRGRRRASPWLLLPLALSAFSSAAFGEEMDHSKMDHSKMDHSQMDHSAMDHAKMNHDMPGQSGMAMPMTPSADKPTKKPASKKKKVSSRAMPGMDHSKMDHDVSVEKGMAAHSGHDMSMPGMKMTGYLGPYMMTREASGTSWQPDASPHEGIHQQLEDWSVMTHGWINLNYDRQDGPRGANKTFVSGMVMVMAQRQLADGTFGVRAMMSPEPFMGANGYPVLLATGETADGTHHLVDRQHPHDLFMELAATYSYNLSKTASVFVYGGLPGEPALGPPAFMHRTSGMDNPEAPISHHWLDSTHITFGVVTVGAVVNDWKVEGSAFRGREPDQYRYDIEKPTLDSFAGRVSWNPVRELSMQVSFGHIVSPEQLDPTVNEDRITASAIYTTPFGDGHLWSTTAAWGRKMLAGQNLDAYLIESSAILKNNVTLFTRAERVDEGELTHDVVGLEGKTFTVVKVSAGGIYDFWRTDKVKFGLGGLVSRYVLPDELKAEYGRDLTSFMVFGRLKII